MMIHPGEEVNPAVCTLHHGGQGFSSNWDTLMVRDEWQGPKKCVALHGSPPSELAPAQKGGEGDHLVPLAIPVSRLDARSGGIVLSSSALLMGVSQAATESAAIVSQQILPLLVRQRLAGPIG